MRRRVDDSEDVSLYYEAKERAYEVPIKEQVIDTRLREIVSLGATLSGDELDGFLSERCSDDSALMQTAVRLLSIPAVVHGGAESDAQSLCVTSVVWPTQPRHMVSRDDSIQWDPLPPGSVLSHRYLIEEYLASGGIGRVYRALDQELDAPVALKTLRPEIANAPAAHRRFKQEVLLARSVTHRHVCRIFDLGCDEERNLTFLTMEFLAGETLQSYIRRNGAVGPVLALSWARQLSGALDTAHRAGIIHCDFKSGNVMVVPGPDGVGRAVVTDFGLAVAVERGVKREPLSERNVEPVDSGISDSASECGAITSPPWEGTNVTSGGSRGPLVGTPSYMSPEQVRGEFLDAASDLYSFGVVLFEMITGRLPFAAPTPRAAALAHVMEEPPDPKSFADVANRWSETILRLLSKEPSQRFSTGREVVSALEGLGGCEVLAGHSIPAECDTFVARTEELRSLVSALESSEPRAGTRVLTIVGPGGTGKTRLAINYGWASVNRWEGGVWFCDLSEARDVEGIVSAVAKSLDVPLGKTDPVRQLEHAIGSRAGSLIILDNFEQVVDYAIPTLGSWATSAARVKFLVTSRERLHVPGELVLELEPLDPETDGTELFEVRARNSRAGFEVGADNRARIQEIVRRLDGIPLAIELAAGRLRILSLDQLAERLEDRFQLLTGGVLGRHQTLRVVMDWSWELLTSWERSAVAQASVFEGGFMLDAAEHVLDVSSASESPPAIDLVQSLVDKSWLSVRVVGERPRFWMYSTIQEYASERLSLDEVPEPEVGRCDREARPRLQGRQTADPLPT